MKFSVKKGYGLQTANYLRQLLLTSVPTWRPIAFSVGTNSNVVTAGDNVMEDTVEISTSLCKYHYDIQSDKDIYKLNVSSQCINIDNLNNEKVRVLDSDHSDIIHALNQNVTLVVYFRRDCGNVYDMQNRAYLQREGVNADNKIILNARHCNYENVLVSVSEKDDWSEDVSVDITASYDIDIDDTVRLCCDRAVELFSEIAKSIK